ILLAGSDKPTRWAAARALGRISGSRAADALLLALRGRRLAGGRLVIELCRAAPDLYLESIIDDPKNSAVRAHLAAALAFRRRRGQCAQAIGGPAGVTLMNCLAARRSGAETDGQEPPKPGLKVVAAPGAKAAAPAPAPGNQPAAPFPAPAGPSPALVEAKAAIHALLVQRQAHQIDLSDRQ